MKHTLTKIVPPLLALSLAACQRLSNSVSEQSFVCGSDFQAEADREYIRILGPQGEHLKGEDFELVGGVPDAEGQLPPAQLISSRGCLMMPAKIGDGSYAIRSRDRALNLSKVLTQSDLETREWRLSSNLDQGMLVDCRATLYASQELRLPLQPLGAGYGLQLFQWNLVAANGQEIERAAHMLKGAEAQTLSVASTWPEGMQTLRLQWRNLLDSGDAQGQSQTCNLLLDRKAPELQTSYLRRSPTEEPSIQPSSMITVKAHDQSPSQVYLCAETTTEMKNCQDRSAYRSADTEASFKSPASGSLRLHYFARDAAGNESPIQEDELTVFQSDRMNRIRLGLEEASALAQSDKLQALQKSLKLLGESKDLGKREQAELKPALSEALLKSSLENFSVQSLKFEINSTLGESSYPLGAERLLTAVRSTIYLHSSSGQPLQTVSLDPVLSAPYIFPRRDGQGFAVVSRHTNKQQSLKVYSCKKLPCTLSFSEQRPLNKSMLTQQPLLFWDEEGDELITDALGSLASLQALAQNPSLQPLGLDLAVIFGRYSKTKGQLVLATADRLILWQRDPKREIYSWPLPAAQLHPDYGSRFLLTSAAGRERVLLPMLSCLYIQPLDGGQATCKAWPEDAKLIGSDLIKPQQQDGLSVLLSKGFVYFPEELLRACSELSSQETKEQDCETFGWTRFRVDALAQFEDDAFDNSLTREPPLDWHFDLAQESLAVLYPKQLEVFDLKTGAARRVLTQAFATEDTQRRLLKSLASDSWIVRHAQPTTLEWLRPRSPWTLDPKRMLVRTKQADSFVRVLEELPESITQGLRSKDGPPRYLEDVDALLGLLPQVLVSYDRRSGTLQTQRYQNAGARRSELCGYAFDPKNQRLIVAWPQRTMLWERSDKGFQLVRELYKTETQSDTQCRAQAFILGGKVSLATLHTDLSDGSPLEGKLLVYTSEGEARDLGLPETAKLRDFTLSTDGRWLAYLDGSKDSLKPSLLFADLRPSKDQAVRNESKAQLEGAGIRSLQFSPDGEHLTVLIKQSELQLYTLNQQVGDWSFRTARSITPAPSFKIIQWMPDSKGLALLSQATMELLDLKLSTKLRLPLSIAPESFEIEEGGAHIGLVAPEQTLLFPLDLKQQTQRLCQSFQNYLASVKDSGIQRVCDEGP